MTGSTRPLRRSLAYGAAAAAAVIAVVVAIVQRPLSDDRIIMRRIRTGAPEWLVDAADTVAPLAGLVGLLIVTVLAAAVFAVRDRGLRRAGTVVAAAALAVATSRVVAVLVDRPRPPLGWQRDGPDISPAFPAGDVAGWTAVLLAVVLVAVPGASRAARAGWAAAALLVGGVLGLSRMVLLMQWTSDVVGGLLLAVVCAGLAPDAVSFVGRVFPRTNDRDGV